jgi:hypothetical protein
VALTLEVSAPILRAQAVADRAVVHAAAGRADQAAADFAAALALHDAKGDRLGEAALARTRAGALGVG